MTNINPDEKMLEDMKKNKAHVSFTASNEGKVRIEMYGEVNIIKRGLLMIIERIAKEEKCSTMDLMLEFIHNVPNAEVIEHTAGSIEELQEVLEGIAKDKEVAMSERPLN